MSDDELFANLSEIADEEIMRRNPASIIAIGRAIEKVARRAALEEAALESVRPARYTAQEWKEIQGRVSQIKPFRDPLTIALFGEYQRETA
jgi:hypothetical protein